jgi:O-antigen ligase
MSGMEIFSTFLLVGIVLHWLSSGRPVFKIPFFSPILFFSFAVFLGVILGQALMLEKLRDISRLRFFLFYIATFYYLTFILSTHPTDSSPPFWKWKWFRLQVGFLCIIAIYGFVQHFVAIDLIRPEGKKVLLYAIQTEKIGPIVVGTFNHHLTFSNIFLLYACWLSALGLGMSSALRGLGAFYFLLCFWTQSRIAWVALPACMLVLLSANRWKKFLLSVGGVLVLLGVLYLTDIGFRERIYRTFYTPEGYFFTYRFHLWKANWIMFLENPFLGIGYNNNERFVRFYFDKLYGHHGFFSGHAHNEILQILSTTGILGFLGFFWMWGSVFSKLFKVMQTALTDWEKWAARGLIAGFIGFHIQGLTQWNFGDAEVLHNIMFFFGISAWLSSRSR